jgi:hypothetical protein
MPPRLGCGAVPEPELCAANAENCLATFVVPQSGQEGDSSSMRTSSSKWLSQLIQTYS